MMSPFRRIYVAVVSLTLVLTCLSCACITDEEHEGREGDVPPVTGMWLGTPSVQGKSTDGVRSWDLTLPVIQVMRSAGPLLWSGMVAVLQDARGVMVNITVADSTPAQGAGPWGYHIESAGDPSMPDVGDAVVLGGLDRSYQGASITLPGSTGSVTAVVPRWYDGISVGVEGTWASVGGTRGDMCDVHFAVMGSDQPVERLPWGQLSVKMSRAVDVLIRSVDPFPAGGITTLELSAWYIEGDCPDGLVSPDDEVVLANVPRAYAGSWAELLTGNVGLGYVPIPQRLPSPSTSLNLTIEGVTPSLTSADRWDLGVGVQDAGTDNVGVQWSDVTLEVIDEAGDRTLLSGANLTSPDHPIYLPRVVESSPSDGTISAGDLVEVPLVDRSFESAVLHLYQNDEDLGSVRLPSSFPDRTMFIDFTGPEVTRREENASTVWNLAFMVDSVAPVTLQVPWDRLFFQVDNTTSTLLQWSLPGLVGSPFSEGLLLLYMDSDGHGNVSAGDMLLLRGVDASFEGAVLSLQFNGSIVQEVALPVPFPRPYPSSVAVNVSSPSVQPRMVGTTLCYDVTFNINKITPRDTQILWVDLSFTAYSASNAVLVEKSSLLPDPGEGGYDSDPSDGLSVEVWYISATGGGAHMNAGDALRMTGLDLAFEDATVELWLAGHLIAKAVLPTNFP